LQKPVALSTLSVDLHPEIWFDGEAFSELHACSMRGTSAHGPLACLSVTEDRGMIWPSGDMTTSKRDGHHLFLSGRRIVTCPAELNARRVRRSVRQPSLALTVIGRSAQPLLMAHT